MLEQMRESSKNGLTMVIFAIIMVVFAISFGAPMDGCQGGQSRNRFLADINGHDVMSDEVRMVLYRANVSNMTSEQIQTEQSKALRAVLLIHLLADRARDLGLRVSSEEFAAYMTDPLQNVEFMRSYGQNGTLDGRYYENYVQYQLGVNIKSYERFKREELLARKYLDLAQMQIGAFPGAVEELRALRGTKVDLEYVKLTPGAVAASIVVSDEDAKAWAEANKEALEKAYKAKENVYKKPARFNVRRLMLSKPGQGIDADKAKELENVIGLAQKRLLEDKEDFVKVIEDIGPDFEKKTKGALGWKTKENLDGDIFKAIEGAKLNEIVKVDTDYATIFVRVEDKEEAKTTPLADVSVELAKEELQKERAAKRNLELLEELKARAAKDSSTLQAALDALKKDEAAANAPEDGEEPKDGEEAKPAPASKWDGVRVGATGKFNLEPKAPQGLQFNQLPPQLVAQLSSWNRVPQIGPSTELILKAFELTKEKPLAETIYDVAGAKVIVRLKDREEPKADEPKKEGDDATATADSSLELEAKIASDAFSEVSNPGPTTGWPSLFLYPEGDDYGPWLESIYQEAVRTKAIRFNTDEPAAKMLATSDPVDALPAIKLDGASDEGEKKDEKADEKKDDAKADEKK